MYSIFTTTSISLHWSLCTPSRWNLATRWLTWPLMNHVTSWPPSNLAAVITGNRFSPRLPGATWIFKGDQVIIAIDCRTFENESCFRRITRSRYLDDSTVFFFKIFSLILAFLCVTLDSYVDDLSYN